MQTGTSSCSSTTSSRPHSLTACKSLFDISIDDLASFVRGTTVNDSLAGKIMLSQQYLKAFYPHHAPSFNKLPEDVRFELMDADQGAKRDHHHRL